MADLVIHLPPIEMRDPEAVAWDDMVARTPGFSLRSLSRRYPHPEERLGIVCPDREPPFPPISRL